MVVCKRVIKGYHVSGYMYIQLDRTSGVPVYRQIILAVIEMIESGLFAADERLPSSRDLAHQLGVTRKTVIYAYQELVALQYLDSRIGSGTYVSKLKGKKKKHSAREDDYPEPVFENALSPVDLKPMDWGRYKFFGDFFAIPRKNIEKYKGKEPFISFARALPDPGQFPFDRIKKIAGRMLWYPKEHFFSYGHPQGYQPLVKWLLERLASEQVDVRDGKNDVILAGGFQLALNLLLTFLIGEKKKVAVEDPTYTSILNSLIARKIEHVGVPVESDGMDVKALGRVLESDDIGAIITVPTLHNPTGTIMSLEKRQELLRLSAKHQVPIIEDVYLMFLGHDGKRLPSLKALDRSGYVFQVGSFSKVFLPGLRIGWITTPSEVALPLVKLKRATDQGDSFFLQTLLHEFIIKGYFDMHLRKVERVYNGRREIMREELRKNMPKRVKWTMPAGGLSFWLELPIGESTKELYEHALKAGIEIAPGNFFFVGKRDTNHFRLAFSMVTQQNIKDGIRRLGKAVSSFLAGRKAK